MIYTAYSSRERRGAMAYGGAETINQGNTIVCARIGLEAEEADETVGVTDSL